MIRVGESALRLSFADTEAVLVALARLASRCPPTLRDLVPGANTLLAIFHVPPGPTEEAWIASANDPAAHRPGATIAAGAPRRHTIPVHYAGPDLESIAAAAAVSPAEVARLHAAATYRVAFVGFQPGFAYLSGLPPLLHSPRRAVPRSRVASGSVAIGGEWTGVYPTDSPGGWHLIGHTDTRLFDATREAPALLSPGDVVRFVPQ